MARKGREQSARGGDVSLDLAGRRPLKASPVRPRDSAECSRIGIGIGIRQPAAGIRSGSCGMSFSA